MDQSACTSTTPAFAFIGHSNSGKTTLVVKVIAELAARGYRVGSIKHHGHVGFDIDIPGKDSWRHTQAGRVHTVIASPDKVASIRQTPVSAELPELIATMGDVDIIIVEGGRNDYNFNVPLGTLEDTTTKTMMGATRYLLTKLRERYPNAVIIGLTCWETGGNKNKDGHYCREYGQAMLDICADLGIPCINALDQGKMGVYMTDPNFRAKYCRDANDVSHLNDDGMKLVLPVFERYIAEIYEEYRKNP